jgi:ABC-type transporter Mla subunit MlaD
MEERVVNGYKEPKAEVDKDEAKIDEISKVESDRMAEARRALDNLNGTSTAWGNTVMQTLTALGNQLSRGRQTTDNSRRNIDQRLQQTKDRIAQLVRALQDLAGLKARLAAVAARAGEVQTKEGLDYSVANAQVCACVCMYVFVHVQMLYC